MSKVIKLNNVRLSFPALWTPRKFAPTDAKGSYSATFILDKKINAIEIAEIKRTIDLLVRENLKGKHPGATKIALHDGSEKPDVDGYGEGVMYLSARTDKAPPVIDRNMDPLVEADNKPVAGDYVRATIELWAQDNQYGKRINAKLRGVQFYKAGTPFGEGRIDVSKEFSPIEDDDEQPI